MGNNEPAVDQSDLRIRGSYGLKYSIVYYCMKPPKIKAPKCTSIFNTVLYFPGSKVTRAHGSLRASLGAG